MRNDANVVKCESDDEKKTKNSTVKILQIKIL